MANRRKTTVPELRWPNDANLCVKINSCKQASLPAETFCVQAGTFQLAKPCFNVAYPVCERPAKRAKPDYRVHLPLGVLTGPGWKNFSGVITPSVLNTIPFFITNCTLRNASISVRGFPATAIRSA